MAYNLEMMKIDSDASQVSSSRGLKKSNTLTSSSNTKEKSQTEGTGSGLNIKSINQLMKIKKGINAYRNTIWDKKKSDVGIVQHLESLSEENKLEELKKISKTDL